MNRWSICFLLAACASFAASPRPAPELPGVAFQPPPRLSTVGAPLVFEHSAEAGPDETFLAVGENLTTNVLAWGVSANNAGGQEWRPRVLFLTNGCLAASLPERAQDGPFLVWVKNDTGWSEPFVLNQPQPWWCGPDIASAGDQVRIFGRNLARRPDSVSASVYLCQPGRTGIWATVSKAGKYSVAFGVPEALAPGEYEVWVHAGSGGAWGWGGPVKLQVTKSSKNRWSDSVASSAPKLELKSSVHGLEIQQAMDNMAERGGGVIQLPEGKFSFNGTLRVPKGVTLRGAGKDRTTLDLVPDRSAHFTRLSGSGWNQAPGAVHSLPSGDRAAVWLAGDGASVSDLTILGDAQVNIGIAIRSPQPTRWLTHCQIARVRVADCDGKQGENCGVLARYADHCRIDDNELWGRAPLFISGAKRSEFARNRLVSVTRFGGNAEAAILGRNETIEECVVEDNVIASPVGAEAGSPTARRLLWFSTGHGSITRNWIANNGVEKPNGPGADLGAGQARFGGVAGTDQNVGEMILFEANHRTAYFGPLAAADAASVTLPKTIPPTPDDRLGNVTRAQLARDPAGHETPFWPPDLDDGTEEPPIFEYYVTVFSGRGQGQTRRVAKRDGERLLLASPWTVAPQAGSIVAVGTAFSQNLIVGNHTPDGMTGIQLWISCVENVVAGNTIARQRKPGLFFYANGTTLASSMPRTWNRGISPLFWNVAEGNRTEDCSAGALVTSGDEGRLPIEFPRAVGNVLRHNSFVRSRTDGVILTSRHAPPGIKDTSASIVGTIVEFNVVRDALVGYHAGQSSDATVFRRNHAYFWYPVANTTNAPVGFQIDEVNTTASIEKNSIEGIHGVHDGRIIDLRKPGGSMRLPEE